MGEVLASPQRPPLEGEDVPPNACQVAVAFLDSLQWEGFEIEKHGVGSNCRLSTAHWMGFARFDAQQNVEVVYHPSPWMAIAHSLDSILSNLEVGCE